MDIHSCPGFAPHRLLHPVCILALVVLVRPALAGSASKSLEYLTGTLIRHRNFKVRLQAAVVLARARDPRALAALAQCLKFDSHHLVRAVCATALGRLGLTKARKTLTEALKDRHPFVRSRAKKALKVLEATKLPSLNRDWTKPPRKNAKYFLRLGNMSMGKAGAHSSYRKVMREGFWSSLRQHHKLELGYPGDKPPPSYLKKYRLKSFTLVACLVKLTPNRKRNRLAVNAKLRATLVAYPERKIVMITSAATSASQRIRGELTPDQQRQLYHRLKTEAIQSAAHSISRNIWRYLKRR